MSFYLMRSLEETLSLLEIRVATSVRVGALWLTVDQARKYVSQTSTQLFEHTGYSGWEVRDIGSCTLLSIGNKYFAIATWHQVKNADPESIGILESSKNCYITSAGMTKLDSQDADRSDRFDLIALDYSEPVEEHGVERNNFLRSFEGDKIENGERIIFGAIYGHAQSDQRHQTDDEDSEFGTRLTSFESVKREVICTEYGSSFEDSLFTLSAQGLPQDINLNGFSGSPVYLLCGTSGNFSIKFGGLVVRAGNGIFHCLKHSAIRNLISRTMNETP